MTLPGSEKCSYSAVATENRIEKKIKSKFLTCDMCDKTFSDKGHLKTHIKSHYFILDLSEEERGKQNICDFCYKRFTAKKNLLKHLRNIHKKFSEAEQMVVKKIKCPERGCKFICRMMKDLRFHIEESHNIKILKDTLQFQNEKVFQKWKKEEESNSVSWFVTGRKKTTLTNGSKKQIFYCHRTGQYNPKSYRKYRVRSVGSCKIGMTCPASMEVTEFPDGHFTVIYYKTHLGHVQDVVYLKLSKEERVELAEKIQQGFSFDAILEDVRESVNPIENKKRKIHLLSKKDLYRIMRTENVSKTKTEKTEEQLNKSENVVIRSNDNLFSIENLETKKGDDSFQHGFCSVRNTLLSEEQTRIDENFLPQKIHQNEIKTPEASGEGVTPQIVIFSPDIDYTSVARIILLNAGETSSQGALTHVPVEDQKLQGGNKEIKLKEGNKIRSNLSLPIKEKLDKILELLPKSEFLTPKQFNLICTKLDGILDVFNATNAKAKARLSPKRKLFKKKTENEGFVQWKTDHGVLAPPVYDSSLLYAVFN